MEIKSKLYSLGKNDFIKGAVSALIAGFIFALGSVVSQAGFSVFDANWFQVFDTAINAGLAALIGYLGKNYLSDSEGTVLGKADVRT